jgi:WD40 repeat protein
LVLVTREAGQPYGLRWTAESASRQEDVRTIVCIDEAKEKIGVFRRLSDSGRGEVVSEAFVPLWHVRVLTWPELRLVGATSLRGSPPRDLQQVQRFGAINDTGVTPDRRFDEWLANGYSTKTLIPSAKTSLLSAIAFSPNGRMVALADAGTVTLWDTSSGRKLNRLSLSWSKCENDGTLNILALHLYPLTESRDELVILDDIGRISWWDPARGKESREECVLGPIRSAAFSSRRMAAYSRYNGEFGTVDLAKFPLSSSRIGTPSDMGPPRNPQEWNVCDLAFSPDGARLAAGCHDDRRARVYEVATGKELFHVETASSTLPLRTGRNDYSGMDGSGMSVAVAWSPTGEALAVGLANGELLVASATNGQVEKVLAAPPRGSSVNWVAPSRLLFGRSGRRLYVGGQSIAVWDVSSSTMEREIRLDGVADLAISSDGRVLGVAVSGQSRLGRLFEVD